MMPLPGLGGCIEGRVSMKVVSVINSGWSFVLWAYVLLKVFFFGGGGRGGWMGVEWGLPYTFEELGFV